MHTIKERLASGQLVRCFSLGRFVHPVVVDLFALAGGYHGFWLDQEHAGLTYEQIVLAAVCGRANQLDCLVRLQLDQVDAVLTDNALAAGQAAQDPSVHLIGSPLTHEPYAVAMNLGACVHLETLYGENSHHIAESGFKALARALRQAVEPDPKTQGQAASTKGVL